MAGYRRETTAEEMRRWEEWATKEAQRCEQAYGKGKAWRAASEQAKEYRAEAERLEALESAGKGVANGG